jgi:hypothetical protein
MSRVTEKRDLLVLVSDGQMQETIEGILSRPQALGIRPVAAVLRRHPRHDNGCCREGAEFFRPFIEEYQYALLMFDREGCGQESMSAEELERQAEAQLADIGWQGRAAAIVLDPELEIWVWSDSPHVDAQVGWSGRPALRDWLRDAGYLVGQQVKPAHPKEALEAALRKARKRRSSAVYRALAEKVSLSRCSDRAFLKLKSILQTWFLEAR